MSEVRTGYVGTQEAGDILTSDNFDKLPGGWLGYATQGTDQAAASGDITDLSVTVTVGDSRLIRVSALVKLQMSKNGANAPALEMALKEDGTQIYFADWVPTVVANNIHDSVYLSVLSTPDSGSHTYKATMSVLNGLGTITASTSGPNYILVEDLGPAPAA